MNTAVGIRHPDHMTSSIRKKVGTNFADKRLDIVRLRTQVTDFSFFLVFVWPNLGEDYFSAYFENS
jgi:hypothetical protein